MVCCLSCFRRGNCVAHQPLSPLEHFTASAVALQHISHSHIIYIASVHSTCPFWNCIFYNQSSFLLSLFMSVFVSFSFFTSIPFLHLSLSISAPWPPHCRFSSTFSPASRHVVSSISRAYSSLQIIFSSPTGNRTCFYMCLSLWINVVLCMLHCLPIQLLCSCPALTQYQCWLNNFKQTSFTLGYIHSPFMLWQNPYYLV